MINTINAHYQRSSKELRNILPDDIQNTWEKYVAMAIDWWWDHIADARSFRKDVSSLGGYIADYMNIELSCRSGR